MKVGMVNIAELPNKLDTMSRDELVIMRSILKKALALANKKLKK